MVTVIESRRHLAGTGKCRWDGGATKNGCHYILTSSINRIFSVQQERVVAKDNTVRWGERVWQLERTRWRGTLAGCRVTICEHLDGQVSIAYGPHVVGRYTAEGKPLQEVAGRTRKPGAEARCPTGALTPVALRAPAVGAPTARA